MKSEVYVRNEEVQKKLNTLLSDYQVYYQNLRAFHWLVKGAQFFQLHGKFEELYNHAAEDIDEIAERIMMIGGVPLHSFDDYLQHANIVAERNLVSPQEILPVVIGNTEHLLVEFRVILNEASESLDEGTVTLMSQFISNAEKELWMLNSLQA